MKLFVRQRLFHEFKTADAANGSSEFVAAAYPVQTLQTSNDGLRRFGLLMTP